MRQRLLYALLAAGLVLIALVAFTTSAAAEKRSFQVRLADGSVVTVTVDVPPGTPLDEIPLPGQLIAELPSPEPPAVPTPGGAPGGGGDKDQPAGGSGGTSEPSADGGRRGSGGDDDSPRSGKGRRQEDSGSRRPARRGDDDPATGSNPRGEGEGSGGRGKRERARRRGTPMRRPDGRPTRTNPGFFDALPGPSTVEGVPNFVIRKFRVPPFLLSIYQAAGIQYGIRWEYLAAINEIETDYGRNLNVSSAGALGWMQFMPATWRMYGVDANDDNKKDPYNPVDAIFAAARYLKAAGAPKDMRKAIFAYNHADWYVDSVMLRARLIAGVPNDLIGSLTGLTQGRFPVAARAQYADDIDEREAVRRVQRNRNAANVVDSNDERRGIDIFAKEGAPVVAVNDGVIKKIGVKNGRKYVVMQDAYGNRYTYEDLGSVSRHHPVPKDEAGDPQPRRNGASAISANGKDPKPTQAASAGRQVTHSEGGDRGKAAKPAAKPKTAAPRAEAVVKQRLFAHPGRPNPRKHGGAEQIFDHEQGSGEDGGPAGDVGLVTYRNYFARGISLSSDEFKLKPLRKGSRVIGGTILGRVGGDQDGKASHIYFRIRPAGRGAPSIDPKPILDGWKLLESTAIYRAKGKNALYGRDGDAFSIGQILLLPKTLLEKRVLSDERVEIYPCGRRDIKSGQIDRRVLATLEYLAESGLRPTVTSLKCGHGFYTSSGNVSHHSSGNAVDIARLNGIPILGHQDRGGITEQGVERLMLLQGTMRPDQIISLLDMGQNSIAMGDHDDHIHVGFRPLFGSNKKLGKQAMAVLKPGQWNDLIGRLRDLELPTVRPTPSRYAIPVKPKRRASRAHRGE